MLLAAMIITSRIIISARYLLPVMEGLLSLALPSTVEQEWGMSIFDIG
jgi:hypothetical protein